MEAAHCRKVSGGAHARLETVALKPSLMTTKLWEALAMSCYDGLRRSCAKHKPRNPRQEMLPPHDLGDGQCNHTSLT